MSKFEAVINRGMSEKPAPSRLMLDYAGAGALPRIPGAGELIPLPILDSAPARVARSNAIRRLAEQVAPMAAMDNSVRMLISACRPGDGASTVTSALAIDLSQRLGLRTIVVDAHLRHPTLDRTFLRRGSREAGMVFEDSVNIRPTEWPRLDIATCCPVATDDERIQQMADLEGLLNQYSAAVVDLGVPRLDARMLPLARPNDPILLVVRYGYTERHELATTVAGLRSANRPVAGVVLNGATTSVAKPLRRLFGT
jgi:Mrp family chromosome partitioning ATPase